MLANSQDLRLSLSMQAARESERERDKERGTQEGCLLWIIQMQWPLLALLGHQMSCPTLHACCQLHELRNVSKQKALHTYRRQSKYKLNFLLKDNGWQIFKQSSDRGNERVTLRVRVRAGVGVRVSVSERAAWFGLVSLSSSLVLSKNENINSQRVICAPWSCSRCERTVNRKGGNRPLCSTQNRQWKWTA